MESISSENHMTKHLNASTYSFTIPSSQLKVLQKIGTMKEYMEAFKVLVTGSTDDRATIYRIGRVVGKADGGALL
jgi:hypothetical protein